MPQKGDVDEAVCRDRFLGAFGRLRIGHCGRDADLEEEGPEGEEGEDEEKG